MESTPAMADARAPQTSPSWRATLREIFTGSRQDFTEGSIRRALLLLAVPMVLETSMESLFAIVNVFWVAHLGQASTAAVGITESLVIIIFAVAMGLSMGTTAMVARRIGEKDRQGASVAAFQGIVLGISVALPVGLIGILFTPQLFHLMGASDAVLAAGSGYSRIIIGANVVVMLLFLNNAVFRGAGDAAIAMRVLWFANVINLILDPCLIYGLGPFPRLGVTGSAIATTIGRGAGVAFQFYVLSSGKGRVRLSRAGIDVAVMLRLLRVSLTGTFQFLVATASWLGLMRIIARFGDAAIAGYMIAIRIIMFALLPSWGMSMAAATLVGQNLGAGKPDRAERSVWVAGVSNMFFLGGVSLIYMIFAGGLIRLFTNDASVVPYGTDALRYISYGYVFYAYGMVMVSAFNGAGDTATPMWINLCCYWLVQIPLAYTLALGVGLGTQGVFLAITIAQSVLAVVAILMFRRGRWKTRKI
ncbi:MAG TPA: MATE family efflux transporter [Blastocatellia bacterium]|nr:MATE family efflux transporter [Blastocatellia bacterium]